MNYRIGYIGFGTMAGGYHYDSAVREDVPFTATAVFDLREEQRALAESRGLRAFDNLKDFLDSRLFDLVVVATPNQYHCEMTCAALEAGYHVMCEKPVAMNVSELEKMIATSKRVGKMFTVHHNRRWDKDTLMLKQALDTGKLGKLITLENRIHFKDGSGMMFGWRMYEDHGGGLFGDWGIHMLDQLLYIIDEPIRSVWGKIMPIRSGEVDDYSKVIITFESGLTAQVEAAGFSPIALPKWYAVGDRGAVVIPNTKCEGAMMRCIGKMEQSVIKTEVYPDNRVDTREYDKYLVTEWEEIPLPITPIPQDWAALYKNVAAALDGKEQLVVTPESVLRCFRVLEAAKKSSETGLAVEF